MSYVGTIVDGLRTLVTGLRITGRESTKKAVTLQYPHEKPELSEAYRSLIQLKRFDDLGTHDCVACLQCEKICPSFCIKIEGGKVEGIKRKRASKFEVDFALCSLCGLCIDTCPTDTLEYSRLYDEADENRKWVFDLLDPFQEFEDEFVEQQKIVEQKQAEERAAKAAAAKAAKEKAEAAKAAKARAEKPESEGTDDAGKAGEAGAS